MEEVAPLPVVRLVQEIDKLREAMKAVELMVSLVPGNVVESLRDVVKRGVEPVAQAPVPLTDRELSRRFTELTYKKRTLETKLCKHRSQVEKAREHFWVEEERMEGWRESWWWLWSRWKR